MGAKFSLLPKDIVKESDLKDYVKTADLTELSNQLNASIVAKTFDSSGLAKLTDLETKVNIDNLDETKLKIGGSDIFWINKEGANVIPETLIVGGKNVLKEIENKADKTELSGYTSKIDFDSYVNSIDLSKYAKFSDLDSYAKTEQLQEKADKTELSGYTTKTDFDNYVNSIDLDKYAKFSDLDSYAKTEQLQEKADKTELSGYTTKTDFDNYVNSIDLDKYAKFSDLDSYAKASDLQNKVDKNNDKETKFQIGGKDIFWFNESGVNVEPPTLVVGGKDIIQELGNKVSKSDLNGKVNSDNTKETRLKVDGKDVFWINASGANVVPSTLVVGGRNVLTEIDSKASKSDLTSYAKTLDLTGLAKTDDITKNFAPNFALDMKVDKNAPTETKLQIGGKDVFWINASGANVVPSTLVVGGRNVLTEIDSKASKSDLTSYAKTLDLTGLAKTDDITKNFAPNFALDMKVDKNAPTETKLQIGGKDVFWINASGANVVPSTLVVGGRNVLTEIDSKASKSDLTSYAKTLDLTGLAKTDDITKNFAPNFALDMKVDKNTPTETKLQIGGKDVFWINASGANVVPSTLVVGGRNVLTEIDSKASKSDLNGKVNSDNAKETRLKVDGKDVFWINASGANVVPPTLVVGGRNVLTEIDSKASKSDLTSYAKTDDITKNFAPNFALDMKVDKNAPTETKLQIGGKDVFWINASGANVVPPTLVVGGRNVLTEIDSKASKSDLTSYAKTDDITKNFAPNFALDMKVDKNAPTETKLQIGGKDVFWINASGANVVPPTLVVGGRNVLTEIDSKASKSDLNGKVNSDNAKETRLKVDGKDVFWINASGANVVPPTLVVGGRNVLTEIDSKASKSDLTSYAKTLDLTGLAKTDDITKNFAPNFALDMKVDKNAPTETKLQIGGKDVFWINASGANVVPSTLVVGGRNVLTEIDSKASKSDLTSYAKTLDLTGLAKTDDITKNFAPNFALDMKVDKNAPTETKLKIGGNDVLVVNNTGVNIAQGDLKLAGRTIPKRKCVNKETPLNDEGDKTTIFLDRHNVACADNENLTQFQLVRNGDGRFQYKYRCCEGI